MHGRPLKETLYQWAKRLQRQWYFVDYEDRLKAKAWLGHGMADLGVQVKTFIPKLQLKERSRILIFKPDEIGDAICSLPALSRLRLEHPKVHLAILCDENLVSFYERTHLLDEIIPVRRKKNLFGFVKLVRVDGKKTHGSDFDVSVFLRTYPRYFRAFKREFSVGNLVHPDDPRLKSSSLFRSTVRQWGEQRSHHAIQLMEILRPLLEEEVQKPLQFPKFHWRDEDRSAIQMLKLGRTPDYFVVHPFARMETRRYPLAYWGEILQFLRKKYLLPIIIIGGKEDPILPSLDGILQAQGKLTLNQSGYLISKSAAFFGNESGPAHWAGALGKPVVCFFGGHSLPQEWSPLGRSLILRVNVPCAPCHQKVCPGYGVACLTELTPKKVMPEIEGFLDKVFETRRESAPSKIFRLEDGISRDPSFDFQIQ